MDKFDQKTRSRIMSAIKSKNTSPEVMVFRGLGRLGIHFQKHYARTLGTPDIALPSRKRAVFIDGDFWHGFRYPTWKNRLKSKFWRNKIERNRDRDRRYHQALRNAGWKVMRVWEHHLQNDLQGAIRRIAGFLKRK